MNNKTTKTVNEVAPHKMIITLTTELVEQLHTGQVIATTQPEDNKPIHYTISGSTHKHCLKNASKFFEGVDNVITNLAKAE